MSDVRANIFGGVLGITIIVLVFFICSFTLLFGMNPYSNLLMDLVLNLKVVVL